MDATAAKQKSVVQQSSERADWRQAAAAALCAHQLAAGVMSRGDSLLAAMAPAGDQGRLQGLGWPGEGNQAVELGPTGLPGALWLDQKVL